MKSLRPTPPKCDLLSPTRIDSKGSRIACIAIRFDGWRILSPSNFEAPRNDSTAQGLLLHQKVFFDGVTDLAGQHHVIVFCSPSGTNGDDMVNNRSQDNRCSMLPVVNTEPLEAPEAPITLGFQQVIMLSSSNAVGSLVAASPPSAAVRHK